MSLIVPVVEGPGDAAALPVLLRIILAQLHQHDIGVATPKNAHGSGNLYKPGGLERFVQYACRTPECGGVLVVIDTDSDENCPKTLAPELAARARALRASKPIAVVLANREYEVWLLASIETIAGKPLKGSPGIGLGVVAPSDCEGLPSPKAWLERQFRPSTTYKETLHQAPMSAHVDPLIAAARSRSFARLLNAVGQLTTAMRSGLLIVTP
jgi:hypothetical protein